MDWICCGYGLPIIFVWWMDGADGVTPRQIDESISIADFFPPNRRVDFYCRFLPAKLTPLDFHRIDHGDDETTTFLPHRCDDHTVSLCFPSDILFRND